MKRMSYSEFLNVAVSQLCNRANFFLTLRKFFIIVFANKKCMHLNSFFLIHTYYVILGVIFPLFLAQHFRTKVFTAQKNLLLECVVLFTLLRNGGGRRGVGWCFTDQNTV